MGVEAAAVGQGGVEAEVAEADEAGAPKLEAAGHNLDVALLQCVGHHVFILLHHHAAGGVDLQAGDGRGALGMCLKGWGEARWEGRRELIGQHSCGEPAGTGRQDSSYACQHASMSSFHAEQHPQAGRHAPRSRRWQTPRPPGRWPPAAAASAGRRTSRSHPGSCWTARGRAGGGGRGRLGPVQGGRYKGILLRAGGQQGWGPHPRLRCLLHSTAPLPPWQPHQQTAHCAALPTLIHTTPSSHLDRWVLCDDASAGAGGIQQHAVHAALAQHLWQLPPVVVAHHCRQAVDEMGRAESGFVCWIRVPTCCSCYAVSCVMSTLPRAHPPLPRHTCVCDAHALQVGCEAAQALLVDFVGKHHAAVAHQGGHVRRLAACKAGGTQRGPAGAAGTRELVRGGAGAMAAVRGREQQKREAGSLPWARGTCRRAGSKLGRLRSQA